MSEYEFQILAEVKMRLQQSDLVTSSGYLPKLQAEKTVTFENNHLIWLTQAYIGITFGRDLFMAIMGRKNNNGNQYLFQCTNGYASIVLRQTWKKCDPIL